MKKCVCGTEFKHASNLSRHQRGNSNQGVKPCIVFADHLAKKLITAGEVEMGEHIIRQLEIYNERHHKEEQEDEASDSVVVTVESFDFDNPPTWLAAEPTVLEEATSGHFDPGKIFEALYCNPDHPESWSVYWPNLKMERVSIWQNGEWRNQDFETWSWEFIVFAILRHYKRDLERMGELSYHLNNTTEGRKDLRGFRKELKNILWGPIRNKIKK